MADSRNKDATIYCGNLDERVRDELLFELMLQAGPVVNVHIPKDRVMGQHQGYGFAEFLTEEDADYAVSIMNQVKLFGKPIRVNKASSDKKQVSDIGAELFIGNLDPMVDEKTLYETFSSFGTLLKAPTISRTEEGRSKGFGFVNFDNFESADAAIEAMNNQFLMNKSVTVGYAFKQGGKGNDKHGDASERLLAMQAKKNVRFRSPNPKKRKRRIWTDVLECEIGSECASGSGQSRRGRSGTLASRIQHGLRCVYVGQLHRSATSYASKKMKLPTILFKRLS